MTDWVRPYSRRLFLGMGGVALGSLAGCKEAPHFSLRPAAFEVDHGSAILWARTDGPHDALFEYSTAPDLVGARRTPARRTSSDHAFVVTHSIDKLEPNTRYYYRAVVPGDQPGLSAIATFKTAPKKGGTLNLVWSADLHAEFQPFTILPHIEKLEPHLFLMLGDATYANHPKTNPAKDLPSFQQKHLDVRRSPELQSLMSKTATYATWDDHDTENNTDRTHPLLVPSRVAFKDYWPVRAVREAGDGLFRTRAWSDLAEFFILDGRSFRDPVDAESPRTMLGKRQLSWLLDALAASKARHRIIVSPVPFLAPFEKDSFYGFKEERRKIIRFVEKKKLDNVTILSADFHCAWELRHKSGIREFIAGPLAAWPFKSIKKGYVKRVRKSKTFAIIDQHNFGQLEIDGEGAFVSYYDVKGKRRFHQRLK